MMVKEGNTAAMMERRRRKERLKRGKGREGAGKEAREI